MADCSAFEIICWLTPVQSVQHIQFLKIFLVQPHLYSLLPLPVLNPVNTNLQGKNVFFAEQIAPETINFLFLSSNCIFNLLIFI
jgi:hypothetical protein